MDLLKEYTEAITKDYVGAEVLGKKVRIKNVDDGIYVHDVDDLLKDYKREYVYLCIIREGDEKGFVETYDGKLHKRGDKLYFVDTTQPDPSRIPATINIPQINIPSVWLPQEGTGTPPQTWTTTTVTYGCNAYGGEGTTHSHGSVTVSNGEEWVYVNTPVLEADQPNRNGNVYMNNALTVGSWNNGVGFTIDADGNLTIGGELHGG